MRNQSRHRLSEPSGNGQLALASERPIFHRQEMRIHALYSSQLLLSHANASQKRFLTAHIRRFADRVITVVSPKVRQQRRLEARSCRFLVNVRKSEPTLSDSLKFHRR